MTALKSKAMESMAGKFPKFRASDGWYKKFCIRNGLNMRDKFAAPRRISRLGGLFSSRDGNRNRKIGE